MEYKDTKVLVDCGSGVLAKVQEFVRLDQIAAVVFSHYHRDHCADLECMQYAALVDLQLKRRTTPLYMWGSKESGSGIPSLSYQEYCLAAYYRENEDFTIGKLHFRVQQNLHDVPSYSIKIRDAEGNVLVYTGDTEFYEQLIPFAQGASCFLCECSLYSAQKGQVPGHLSAGEVGLLAKSSKVKKLVLTHLPHYGDLHQLIAEAAREFNGKILLAQPGMVLRIDDK